MSFANNKTKPNNIDLDSSQTLDNKTLAPSTVIQSGATITTPQIIDPSRLDVKKDTLANLQTYASSATNGQFVFATDTKTMFQVVDGALTGVGGGSANVNYAEGDSSNFENGVGDWVEQTVDLSISQDLVSPLRGSASGKVAKGINGVVNYVSLPFTIDSADLAKILTISFDKSTSANYSDSGDNNFYIRVYDEDKSAEIRGHGEEILAGEGVHSYRFQTDAASTNYSLRIYCNDPSATIYDMVFDNVVIGPQVLSYGSLITDEKEYTLTTSWNANATYSDTFYYRVGNKLYFKGKITLGSAPSGNLTVTLPNGLSIDSDIEDTSTLESDFGSVVIRDNSSLRLAGRVVGNASNTSFRLAAIDATGTVTDSLTQISNSSPFTFASGDVIEFKAKVAIQGWSSNAISSEDLGGREVKFAVRGAVASTLVDNVPETIVYNSVEVDSTSSYDNSTGVFTAPESGFYMFNASFGHDNASITEGNNARGNFVVNGSVYRRATYHEWSDGVTSSWTASGSLGIDLVKGDTVEVEIETTGYGAPLTDGTTQVGFSGTKIASPQTILETETVAARYENSNGETVNNTQSTFTYEDLVKDTHGAYDTSTGVYTVPVSGWYQVNASVSVDNVVLSTSQFLLASIVVDSSAEEDGIIYGTGQSLDYQASVATMIYLDKGASVEIQGRCAVSTTANTASRRNTFSIARIK